MDNIIPLEKKNHLEQITERDGSKSRIPQHRQNKWAVKKYMNIFRSILCVYLKEKQVVAFW